ncbi:MAG: adenine phosphoribosyltransferase [Deltaproteobacteria bacterium]|nr:adenine phosphoribosyltransferase [Deltaproteobacteria bacterium]
MNNEERIKSLLRLVPDFPKKGILYYDISTVLRDRDGLQACMSAMAERLESTDFDLIAGIESRGFIFGTALADRLKKGFVLIRKEGKLPGFIHKLDYALEYGHAAIEICDGAVTQGQKVVLVDDLLATGGTAAAACKLLSLCGADIQKILFLIELGSLEGRDKISEYKTDSILKFE